MNWAPNDLVNDTDLQAYESDILRAFRVTDWEEKRRKAIEDWLGPLLVSNGFSLERLRTRFEADTVFGYTGAAYSDRTSAASSTTVNDINLAAVFATVGTDALYVGSPQAFRGLSVRMLDSVSSATASLTVSAWQDAWVAVSAADGTQKTQGRAFSGGGAITWRVPTGWVPRTLNSSNRLYWVRMMISATPTSATATQIGVIRRSALCAAVTFRTLTLIMREAPTTKLAGPWLDKAEWYADEADTAFQRALPALGGEFETDDPASDLVSETEAAQTTAEVAGRWKQARA